MGDSSEGMEARLDSLLWAMRAELFFLGVSGVVEREEMEKVALEGLRLEATDPGPLPEVGRGRVEEVLALVRGLPRLETLLLLRGREEEWSASVAPPAPPPPLLRKERYWFSPIMPPAPLPLLTRLMSCSSISRFSGSLISLTLSTTASWSLLMNSLISFTCFRTFSSTCGGSLASDSDASSCRFF